MSKISTEKKAYERPTLSHIGGVGEVTLANLGGNVLDITITVGTPLAGLVLTTS